MFNTIRLSPILTSQGTVHTTRNFLFYLTLDMSLFTSGSFSRYYTSKGDD